MMGGFARTERWGTIIAALALAALLLLSFWRASPAAAADAKLAARAVSVDLFGAAEHGARGIEAFPKWRGVLDRYAAEAARQDRDCAGADCRLRDWNGFLATLGGYGRRAQLEAVNAYVNRSQYRSDSAGFGALDYWATPGEFFARGGDCEDYAIAKYLSLRRLGWRAEDLRIAVVLDRRTRQPHAVLVAQLDGALYVLDNLSRDAVDQRFVRHYAAIFALNEHGWFQYRETPQYAALTARDRIAAAKRAAALD